MQCRLKTRDLTNKTKHPANRAIIVQEFILVLILYKQIFDPTKVSAMKKGNKHKKLSKQKLKNANNE